MKKVIVNSKGKEKLKNLNLWLYKDELKEIPKSVKPGDLVHVKDETGRFLALGYANPKSLITVRILSFSKREINIGFFKERIQNALSKRKKIQKITDAYRVVHSEGDLLPGLVIDRYKDYLVLQINTTGMYRLKPLVLEAVKEILNPEGLLIKFDKKVANVELLPEEEEKIGGIPSEIIIHENNVKFAVDIVGGQKTGFFLDQRRNRKITTDYVEQGFEVLDLFSNAGGFGIYAALHGASHVDFVDISKHAVSLIEKNCKLNGITNYTVYNEDAFDFLQNVQKKYDVIVIDPPPFAKTLKEKEGAIRGFKYLVVNAVKALKEKGYIAVFSCSHHITQKDLKDVLLFASSKTGKSFTIVEHMYQDLDHPYLLNAPASFYLKGYLVMME